jgi:predicted ATPase
MLSLVRYNDFDAQELALSKIFDTDRYFQIATVRKAIAELVVYNHFDTTPQSHIRRPMLPTSEKRLLSDGSNLPQMLNTLKINDKPSFSALRETLRNINEQFTDIDFNFIGGNIELMLAEEKLNRSIHVSHLSDGTLRFLCLMSIFFNRERGALVCIDEPEIGLHPDMMHTMIQSLKESATETQFILTTHSAHFLDYFDFEHIRIVEKDEHNASRVAQYTKEDFKGWYEEFSLGKMWRAGDLGGNRW